MTGKRDIIGGLMMIVLAAVVFQQTLESGIILFEDDIDPMLYPRVIAIALGMLGCAIAGRGILAKNNKMADFPVFTNRTVGVMCSLLLYAGLFNLAGFAVSSVLAGCAIAFIMGWRHVVSLIGVNIAAVCCIWFLFVKLLRIPLPTGAFF